MRIASLLLARETKESSTAFIGLQVLALVVLLSGLYGSLPHAFCQAAADSGESGKTADDSGRDLPGTFSASKHSHAFSKPYGYYLNPILEHIQASPEQKAKITTIVQSFRGRIQPLTEEYKQKNQEFLNNVAHGEHPEIIMNEQTHLGRLYSDITLGYCQMSLEVRKVLSPEQIVRYEEFKRQQGWTSTSKPQN